VVRGPYEHGVGSPALAAAARRVRHGQCRTVAAARSAFTFDQRLYRKG
jgi:hypothetical protein